MDLPPPELRQQLQDRAKHALRRTIYTHGRQHHAAGALGRPEPRAARGQGTQALILAAGRGSRLNNGVKCLCDIGGRPLIEHQLEALRGVGIESVALVVGYEQELVREVVGERATFIVNEHYAETNSLYSFMLARDWVDRDVMVLNCDVLFHPDLTRMLQNRGGNALLFDSSSDLGEEEMKVALREGWLDEMSKQLPPVRCRGENVGVIRLVHGAARDTLRVAENLIAGGAHRDWLASAINRTARRHPFRCVDVAGMPWTEIDFPSDLREARSRVWPAIRMTRRAEHSPLPRPSHAPTVNRRRTPSLSAT